MSRDEDRLSDRHLLLAISMKLDAVLDHLNMKTYKNMDVKELFEVSRKQGLSAKQIVDRYNEQGGN